MLISMPFEKSFISNFYLVLVSVEEEDSRMMKLVKHRADSLGLPKAISQVYFLSDQTKGEAISFFLNSQSQEAPCHSLDDSYLEVIEIWQSLTLVRQVSLYLFSVFHPAHKNEPTNTRCNINLETLIILKAPPESPYFYYHYYPSSSSSTSSLSFVPDSTMITRILCTGK